LARTLGEILMPAAERPVSEPSETKPPRKAARRALWVSRLLFGAAALGAMQFVHAPAAARTPFAQFIGPSVWASGDAFGASGDVKLRFTLPAQNVEFPLAVADDPSQLRYQWVSATDTLPATEPMPLTGATVVAPPRAGFYQLLLLRTSAADSNAVIRERVVEPTLAVMVPFAQKAAGILNGYRIGTYLAERLGGHREEPEGFLEVRPQDVDLAVSRHFRLGDFITHDAQADVWPKYVALNPRLLDKLELVVAQVAKMRGTSPDSINAPDVHSGFRTPAHNAQVQRAARDSRHQYGDAADVVIDADGDGRITSKDSRIVASAVDSVEEAHPELSGGLGLYTSDRYRTPYVHIDARGHRSRWRG
jgi:uncharacterized protein YcbK (DUF882 family)